MGGQRALETPHHSPLSSPFSTLLSVYVAWKALLLCVAWASPGPGYDTSTTLLLPSVAESNSLILKAISYTSSKLVRWDALYFVRVAERGRLFEQEWAWGWGWTKSIALIARASPNSLPSLLREAVAGVFIAHACHLLSVLSLYALTLSLVPKQYQHREKTALLAAVLHIISPAGMFLTAPYSEGLFAALNITGMWLYSTGYSEHAFGSSEAVATISASVVWGLASTVRGNGILSGTILAYRAVTLLETLTTSAGLLRMIFTVMAGILVGLGNIVPQWIAYQQYCSQEVLTNTPVWCSRIPPSIFTYVQSHYWNNGFLKYWTVSNIPLFLIALPILIVLLITSAIAITEPRSLLAPTTTSRKTATSNSMSDRKFIACMRLFALPQATLAILATFNFHVQIINRLSCGYPIWYIITALAVTSRDTRTDGATNSDDSVCSQSITSKFARSLRMREVQHVLISSMILYAIVQGGLYASFLPPA